MDGIGVAKAPPRLLNMQEACQRLGGVSTQTVYRLVADGELRIVKVRRRSFVPVSDIDAYIARSTWRRAGTAERTGSE